MTPWFLGENSFMFCHQPGVKYSVYSLHGVVLRELPSKLPSPSRISVLLATRIVDKTVIIWFYLGCLAFIRSIIKWETGVTAIVVPIQMIKTIGFY